VGDAGAGSILLYIGAATGAYALVEQVRFRLARRMHSGAALPGPASVVPFLGGLVQMVKDPYAFWEQQRQYCAKGFSYNSLFGKYILFVTDAEKSREIMAVNDPSKMLMVLHPSAKNILGADNMAFIHGPPHKALRKSFLSLFTRKALSTYVVLQDGLIRRHLASWLEASEGREVEIRNSIRDLNQVSRSPVSRRPDRRAARALRGGAARGPPPPPPPPPPKHCQPAINSAAPP
jgi:cytochrome P450 family 710 subfamily A protein